ncbi:hypothetical protein C8Q73DRAFT_789829 [Cubamyces lactineus]|nr:hypothetical protein C8Q73DRAFT_789829 [Cubamyces lactineus]
MSSASSISADSVDSVNKAAASTPSVPDDELDHKAALRSSEPIPANEPSASPVSPQAPASPTTSTASSVSESSITPTTPPSQLRHLGVPDGSDGEDARLTSSSAPEPDTDFEGMLSSFAEWQLRSRPGTPALLSDWKRNTVDPNASFTRTVFAVKRQQNDIRKQVESLEKELAHIHDKVSHSLDTSTHLVMRAQELVASERKSMEKQHESTSYNIRSLETKLNKAQRHIATLQAQHIADKGLLEQLANEITVLWRHQEDIGSRLQHAEETEQHVRQLAERLRELMQEVRERDLEARRVSMSIPTLKDELTRTAVKAKLYAPPRKAGKFLAILQAMMARLCASIGRLGVAPFEAGARLWCIVVAGLQFGFARAKVVTYRLKTMVLVWVHSLTFYLLIAGLAVVVATFLYQTRSRGDSPIWDALAA